ncbi:hypothetical protein [Bartonella tamiae]|uniref:Uncharacterized protein n=1 Tax=Bartonella tamiae Th239 TaxID=1094558 RepID=J0ZSB6_9HYPH|nr:hypothetical protein [Bartonella tamiae]EJF91653.1 hypothetical protein ME5_00032 [Bartonella tamiae Th239]EJF92672.1 hypothetical protein MEG_01842 [Bartonella tamiae Th307]
METQLAHNLLNLGIKFSKIQKIELSTIGKNCASDGRFFVRIKAGKTFTARKYDDVVYWFSENWPKTEPWPTEILRPSKREDAA